MMVVEPADRRIVEWAMDAGASFYYLYEEGLPKPTLKVHCAHVTGYFHKGRLLRIWAYADDPFFDDVLTEFRHLKGLSGQLPQTHVCPTSPEAPFEPLPTRIAERLQT